MSVAGQCMEEQNCIRAIGVQGAIGLVGDGDRRSIATDDVATLGTQGTEGGEESIGNGHAETPSAAYGQRFTMFWRDTHAYGG